MLEPQAWITSTATHDAGSSGATAAPGHGKAGGGVVASSSEPVVAGCADIVPGQNGSLAPTPSTMGPKWNGGRECGEGPVSAPT
eukprot:CAMPEP_0171065930 /NCGR_PEP_ID=MMETSP0766_2-20121228/7130_1 /TAXON_ID=439317 /ORGANISM="Gambierdiscus australes, Strain CAWD 149" /LENGTH=83 /DNA_ID=CAMNT_0011522071 /DNA_START=200 /DNA_END=452 /DNA_ORIENTATION=-